MGYAYMSIEKVKSINHLNGKMNHNYRLMEVANADPACGNNEEIIAMKEKNYTAAFRKKIADSEYYKTNKVRKNAVIALEVLMTFSKDDINKFDLDSWKQANAQWMKKTFGEDNVISLMYHGDESVPHLHGIVIPMKEGALKSYLFIGSRAKLREMQDDYANAMKDFGLKRGLKNSRALHKDITKYYAELKREVKKELPAVEYRDGLMESAEEYRTRANEVYCAANLHNFGKINVMQRKIDEAETKLFNMKNEKKKAIEKNREYEEELNRYRQLSAQYGSVEEIEKQLYTLKALGEGQAEYAAAFPDKEQMILNMQNSILEVLKWKKDKDRKPKKSLEKKDIDIS